MKRAMLYACVLIGAAASAAPAQDDKIELFSDQGMSSCELSYTGPGLRSVHMFHTGTQGALGGEFMAPKPACWTGATWIGDAIAPPFLTLGSTQSGIAFAFGECLQPPVYLGAINYLVTDAGGTCCLYSALPSPTSPAPGNLVVYDCNLTDLRLATAGSKVMVNPTVDCPNCEEPPPPPPPATNKIELFADQAMSECELAYSGPNFYRVHMFHTGPDAAVSSQFMAPKPACWSNATWVGDTLPFIYLGNTQSGIELGYAGCLQPPIYLGSINYIVSETGPACCPYPVLPAPTSPIPGSIIFVDCNLPYGIHPAEAGQQVMINPNSSCPECELGPVAAHETTWGRVKALYARP